MKAFKITVKELKEIAGDFVNPGEELLYYTSGKARKTDVTCLRVNKYDATNRAKFDRVFKRSKRVVIYVDGDEGEWEGHFDSTGAYWDIVDGYTYVIDKEA